MNEVPPGWVFVGKHADGTPMYRKPVLILKNEQGKATHAVYLPEHPTNHSPLARALAGTSNNPAKRIRQSSKPLLNKLETEWYHVLKSTYPPECPVFSQSLRFMLGNGIWYKPDFIVFGTGQIYGYEVKGPHAFRGGFENLKVCANIYREIKWYLVWKDNGWQEQEILSAGLRP